MKRFLLIAPLLLAGCTDPTTAQKALDDLSFTEIQMTGWRVLTCGEGYFYHTGYSAKNPSGKVVTGAVCSGFLFKGSTVKFD